MSAAASGRAGLGLVSFVAFAVVGAAQLGASCVDGVTPDCSDAAACAPSEGDAAAHADGTIPAPEAGPTLDASEGADADLDAADADGG